jgi:oxygen-dependent protoporphyrinogen oxidase
MQDIDSAGDTLSFTDLSHATAWDDSADSYSRRRIDDELLEQVIEPLSSSCLADAEQVAAAVPLFALRHFIGAGNFNSDQGVEFLPQGLAMYFDVRCRTPVLHVAERADEIAVTWRHEDGCEKTTTADICILAVPGWAAPTIFPQLSPAGLAYFSYLRYATGMAVFLGLGNRPATPVSWINVPRKDLPDSAGIILFHNRAPSRAPEGKALMASHRRRIGSEPVMRRFSTSVAAARVRAQAAATAPAVRVSGAAAAGAVLEADSARSPRWRPV